MKFLIVACTLAFASATYNNQKYYGPQHIPVLDKHGVPVDTLEVQHARSAHLKQVAAAKSTYDHSKEVPIIAHENVHYATKYHGPQHLPIISKLGVPVDTKEVQHARAEHFLHKAHVEENLAEQESSEEDSSSSEEDYDDISSEEDSSEESEEALYGAEYVPVFKGVGGDTAEVQHANQYYYY